MRFHLAPAPLLHLITTILLTSSPVAAGPQPQPSALRGYSYAELFGRWECGGVKCGYYDQLCCSAGSGCYTNAQTQAECTVNGGSSTYVAASGGHWTTYTRTTVVTDKETITTVMSSYVQATATWTASSTARCHYALGESSCMDKCCASNEYCKNGECAPAYPGQTTTTTTTVAGSTAAQSTAAESSASPGVRKTTVSGVVVTTTSSPTQTVPYETPVATGANITMTEYHTSHLSGGEIAGIVIGVLVAIFILALLCFYCCLKGIWDGLLAIFGIGSRKRKVVETEETVRRSHYSSDGRKRTWYGAPVKTRREKRDENVGKDLLGLGAGLGALWVILGLKRRREDRRRKVEQEKYQSEYSYSSDYYTSESSASSDDRRTERYSRHSVRRSDSRRP